jgi:hypothetical protein
LELPKVDPSARGTGTSEKTTTYTRKSVFPSVTASRGLRGGAWRLPFRNWRFAMMLGLIYSLYAWMLQGVSRLNPTIGARGFIDWVSEIPLAGAYTVVHEYLGTMVRSPFLTASSLLFIVALTLFCVPDPGRSPTRKLIGAVHGSTHLVLLLALIWLFSWFDLSVVYTGEIDQLREILLFAGAFTIQMTIIGGILGGLLMGASLLLGVNFNEAYSAQRIEDYKSFVRLNIVPDGSLRIYPIGIDRVKRWELDPDARPGDPYFRPKDGTPPRIHLIEDPIHLPAPTASKVLTHAVFGVER